MLATICDDTWNMLNMQHITPNSKRWDYSDIPSGGTEKIKGLDHMAEGEGVHHLRKDPTQIWPQDLAKSGKMQDMGLESFDCSEIWHMPPQSGCRGTCKISKRFNYSTQGFETSQELEARCRTTW